MSKSYPRMRSISTMADFSAIGDSNRRIHGSVSLQIRQRRLLLEDLREQIPHLRQTLRHRPQIELQWVELLRDLFPFQRRGDGGTVDRAQRVWRDHRFAVAVLHAI